MITIGNILKHTRFVLSASELKQLPADSGYEIAFAGRSNAGKSSVLNALCQRTHLARTSNTPGRTQHINVFAVDDERRLIDLPGYGYAKAPKGIKKQWELVLDHYLQNRVCLRGIIVVMDIRHPLKPFDQIMLDWAYQVNKPIHILLNKADKLTRHQTQQILDSVQFSVQKYEGLHSVQIFSALTREGLESCYHLLQQWFAHN